MSENFNQPREYDAVLGEQVLPPKDSVLGGFNFAAKAVEGKREFL
jgi:hypothetical protein